MQIIVVFIYKIASKEKSTLNPWLFVFIDLVEKRRAALQLQPTQLYL